MTAPASVNSAVALDLVIRATLLIGAAWTAAAMLKRLGASAAARHLAWLACISGLLALPIVWWLAPPLRLPILPLEAAAAAPPATAPIVGVPGAAAPAGNGQPVAAWLLLAAYLTGMATVLLRLGASHVFASRLWHAAGPARDAVWRELLSGLSRDMGIVRPVTLRIASGPVMPMTWGTLAPKILLPAEAHGWTPDRRRFVLLHELAHVARRDSLGRVAASLACALYWVHPGVWFAARRLRLEQEHAADDRLLIMGAPARGYALSLLALARRAGGQVGPDHATAMAGACQLERRVLAITTPVRRDEPGIKFLAAVTVAAGCIVFLTAVGLPVRPLPVPLDLPAIGPVSSAARTGPAFGEGRASEPAAAIPRDDARPQVSQYTFEAPRTASPAPRLSRQPQQAEEARTGSPTPAGAAPRDGLLEQDMPDVVPPIPQREVYGPRLPRQLAAEREFDPRIPEPLRGRNPLRPPQDDNAAGRTTGHRIARGTLRVLSAFLVANSDSMP